MDTKKAVLTTQTKNCRQTANNLTLNVQKDGKNIIFQKNYFSKSVFRHLECSSDDTANSFKARGLEHDDQCSKVTAAKFFSEKWFFLNFTPMDTKKAVLLSP